MRALLCLAPLALAAADAGPLPESGPLHAQVVHALTRLAQGDAAAIHALPDAAFADPPALTDPAAPGLARPWTLMIPWAAPAVRAQAATLRPALLARGALLDPPTSAIPAAPDPPDPGLPTALPAAPPAAEPALRRVAGHLLARPAGAIVWQRALEPGARAWLADDAALVGDSGGLHWIGLDGTTHRLPPLPGDVTVLGIGSGAAFFAQDGRGWRLPRGGGPAAVELGGEALAAPLAGPGASLWLTMDRLVRWDGAAATAVRHGLPAGRGWRLGCAGDRALVLAPDGRAWAIPAYASGDPAADERLGRFGAIEARADLPPAMRFRAALRHGDWAGARGLAADAPDRAALALYAGEAPPPGAEQLAVLPGDPAELALPADAWSRGVAPRARPDPPPAIPADRRHEDPLVDAAEPWPEGESPARSRDGLALGARTWQVVDDGVRAEAVCRDDGTLRWFVRWLPEPGLAAPARALALGDGHLLVGEGDARLLAFAAATGARLLDLRPQRVPVLPGRTWLRLRPGAAGGAIVLHPPGIDDRLGWLGDGGERIERLPARARWLLALPDGERWLALADGTALACADRAGAPGPWRPLRLPAALLAPDEMPRQVEGGIAAGGRRWRWRTSDAP